MSTDLIPETENTGGELAQIISAGDPDAMLLVLEKKAELAPRMRAAIERILVSQTYAQDWTIQGQGDAARACLSSAGAERIASFNPRPHAAGDAPTLTPSTATGKRARIANVASEGTIAA